MFTEIVLIAICGSLLCLDRVFVQTMISRPVIIAPVMGLLLNNLYAGLIIGAIIELIWVDRLPLGTYIPPNDSIAAVVAVAITALAGAHLGTTPPQLIALSVLLALPCGMVAKQACILVIKSNDALSDQALEDAKQNNIKSIERKSYLGLLKIFSLYALCLFTFLVILVPVVVWIYPRFNGTLLNSLSLTYYFLPLLGIAVAINMLKLRNSIPIVCAIFLIVATILEYFHV